VKNNHWDLKIISNTVAQLTAKFVGAGLTLITTTLIIRLSGPAIFGDLTKSLVMIAIGYTAIDFGLNAHAIRILNQVKNPRLAMSEIIGARFLLSLIAIVVINLLVFALPGGYTPALKSVFWLGSLAIIFQGLFTSMNAWFQYQENYWASAWGTIIGSVVGTALTLYYIWASPSLLNFLLANTLGYLATALPAIYFGRQVFGITFEPRRLQAVLRGSLVLGGILLASVAASKLDAIILGVFRFSSEVGEYGFAYRIFDVILVLPVFIMNAVYPRLVKDTAAKSRSLIRRSLIILGLLGLVVALVSWLLAPWILLIRPTLYLSVTSLRLLVLSLPLFFLTAPLMWHLISRRQEKIVFVIYISAALLNGALNLGLSPTYGAPAAAIITGVTELFIFICLLYFSHETDPQH
jgi:O-antigen/teichoic acid export membrane protein